MNLKKTKFLVIICLVIYVFLEIYNSLEFKIRSKKIDNIFYDGIDFNKYNYIGYIEVKRLNLKREIVHGITDDNLNDNHVALDNKSLNLDDDNLILAGHSIKNVFGKLHHIKIGDEIKIVNFYNINYYLVYDVIVVDKTNIEITTTGDLVLITCMKNPNKRLIVKAKKKNNSIYN